MTEENFNEELKGVVASLNQSATFAMSRGGRELFHTNFLAYILEIKSTQENLKNYPYALEVKELIIKNIFSKEHKPKNVIAFRERSNLDLVVMPDPECKDSFTEKNELIVLEAKLKSIPTAEQLKKYDEKLAKGLALEVFDTLSVNQNDTESQVDKIHYRVSTKKKTGITTIDLVLKDDQNTILKKTDVTLSKLLLVPSDISLNHDGWSLLDWKNLLEQITPKFDPSNALLDTLAKDYLESTKNILKVVKKVSEETDKFLIGEEKFKSLNSFINYDAFKGARLHDLVGKVAFHKLHLSLGNDLNRCTIVSEIKKGLPEGYVLNLYSFYSRSIPGLGIQFKKEIKANNSSKKIKSVAIGIQLQGSFYRHFVNRENFDTDEPMLVDCADKVISWIESVGEEKIEKNNENPSSENTKKYRVFDPKRFVYLHKELGDIEYSDLHNLFIQSLKGAAECLQNKDFLNNLEGKSRNEGEPDQVLNNGEID